MARAKKQAQRNALRPVKSKVGKVMGEFKRGKLHSGSKKGPLVTNRRQALAISMNESGLSRKRKSR